MRNLALSLCCVFSFVSFHLSARAATATHHTFLPTITSFGAVEAPVIPQIGGACASLSPSETAIMVLMRTTPEQKRATLVCNESLMFAARQHAKEMADSGVFAHTGPNGLGPNARVRAAGFILPAWYSTAPDGNNIESIAGGQPTAAAAWAAFMGSPAHRQHLLAEVDFYRAQTKYGVAYLNAPNSVFHDYWVILTAQDG